MPGPPPPHPPTPCIRAYPERLPTRLPPPPPLAEAGRARCCPPVPALLAVRDAQLAAEHRQHCLQQQQALPARGGAAVISPPSRVATQRKMRVVLKAPLPSYFLGDSPDKTNRGGGARKRLRHPRLQVAAARTAAAVAAAGNSAATQAALAVGHRAIHVALGTYVNRDSPYRYTKQRMDDSTAHGY
jgi:hypothetical protein